MHWIDISTPLQSGMIVWTGDEPVRVEQTMFLERGDLIDGALCALGNSAPNPVLSTIRYFRDEYEAHISA